MEISEAIAAYTDYVNGLPFARAYFDKDALAEYEADLAQARADMERAWLESSARKE